MSIHLQIYRLPLLLVARVIKTLQGLFPWIYNRSKNGNPGAINLDFEFGISPIWFFWAKQNELVLDSPKTDFFFSSTHVYWKLLLIFNSGSPEVPDY